jgi:PAS domain S-box-containing protein
MRTRVIALSPFARYGIALAVIAAAAALRGALTPVWAGGLPYITFYPAVMLTAWLGGLGPGLAATALSALVADYFWISPPFTFAIANPGDALGLLVFAAMGIFIAVLNEAWRRSTRAVFESEERVRVTLASIGDAVITTDDRGRVTQLNAVAQRLTGWASADATGRPLDEVFVIVNEQTRQPAPNPVDRALRDGVVVGLANHTILVSKDGGEIPIEDSAAPIRADDGRIAGVVMVFRDVTQQRRAERDRAALLEAERQARREAETATQQLQTALQAGRLGTWQYSIAAGEVRWSPGLEAIHGLAPGSFPGTFEAFRQEIHPEDRDHVLSAIGTALEQRREHHVEYRIVRADGAIRWVEGVGQVVCNGDGQPERMLGVCADITERKQLEDERALLLAREQAARAEIERASRLKDEFLAVLSHELRTPLNAVLGYAHLLGSGALSPERARHALTAIQHNAQVQTRLVESLLDVSRILAGKLELHLEELNLATVIDAAVDVLRPAAEEKGIAVDVAVPSISLVGDGARLQQVFWNLLSNAVKFTTRGGRVRVRCVREDHEVRVEVGDTGLGIDAEFLPYVFDRFSQADSHTRRSKMGLGLGLALVREMVQAHGGTVRAESQGAGLGSTFTVTLPATTQVFASPQEPIPPPVHVPDSFQPMDILVVDDDSDVRHLLAFLLESRGATVRTASSVSDAFQAIAQRRPDVLLADLRMPDEDGYSLIRRLRAAEREGLERRLPAIAVTAYASATDRDQAIAAGYDAHVTKPIEPDVLARAVASVLNRLLQGNGAG